MAFARKFCDESCGTRRIVLANMTSNCDQVRDGGIGQNDLHAPTASIIGKTDRGMNSLECFAELRDTPGRGIAMPRSKAAFNVLSFSSRSDEQDEVARVILRLVGA